VHFLCEKMHDENLYVNGSGMIDTIECSEFPSMIHSQGLWRYINSGTVPFSVPLLELQMVLIFSVTQASQYILKRHGVTNFTTQLLVCACSLPTLPFSVCSFCNILI
jgi:hypothetical protein